MRMLLISVAALSLGACDAKPSADTSAAHQTPKETPAAVATATPPLSQEERSRKCSERLMHYRELGVWVHGGVRPGVDRSAWDLMEDSEQDEIFEIAACMATAGLPGERIVTVSEAGNGPEIETRRVVIK